MKREPRPPLPATIDPVRSAALAYASTCVVYARDNDNPWSPDSGLSPDAGRAFVRWIMRAGMGGTVLTRMQVIALARAGEPDAQLVLRDLMLELDSRNIELPPELVAYRMDLIGELVPRSHGIPGAKKKDRFVQNMWIAMTVAAVCDRFGLRPYKSSPTHASGCEVVSEALMQSHIPLNRKAVERIWRDFGHNNMPTISCWSANFTVPKAA